jgi:hypothetical protein
MEHDIFSDESFVDVSPGSVDLSKSVFSYSVNSGLDWVVSDSLVLS